MIQQRIIDNAIKCVDYIVAAHEQGGMDLSGKGFIHLGGGYYSAVWEHPSCPGLAIKVTKEREDEASITYLAWARANPGPHVPKVYHLRRASELQVSVINKLYPLDSTNERLYGKYLRNMSDYGPASAYREVAHVCPVAAVAADIFEFFDGIVGWDLHSGNYMQDENGVMVITDPVTVAYDSDSRTLLTGIERAFKVKTA